MNRLSYHAGNKMFYLYYGGTVYGIDTNNFEVLTMASSLKNRNLPPAMAGSICLTREKNGESELSQTVVFRNLKSDKSQNITEENKLFSVIGFIEDDLVLGVQSKEQGTEWNPQGEIPMERIRTNRSGFETKAILQEREFIFFQFFYRRKSVAVLTNILTMKTDMLTSERTVCFPIRRS